MDRLTCCVVAPAADPLLAGCLESLVGAVDDVVVVTGQPAALGEVRSDVRVLGHDFTAGMGEAHNRALAATRGEWLLTLQAHERLAPSAGRALRAALEGADFDCGLLPLHAASSRDATPMEVLSGKARDGAPVLWPRLVRRTPDLRWDGLVQASVVGWLAEGRRLGAVQAPILAWGDPTADLALPLLRRRVAAAPGDWRARADLARELARTGNLVEARAQVEQAWQEPGSRDGALVILRAFLQLQAGEASAALDTLDSARMDDGSLDLLRGATLERLVGSTGDNPAALRAAEAALTRARQRPSEDGVVAAATSWAADTLLGLVHLHDHRWADALWRFEQALDRKPDHLDAVLGRAEALIHLGVPVDALRTLEPVLTLSDSDGWMLAASACEALGLSADAAPLLARARDGARFAAPHRARATEQLTARIQAVATLEALDPEGALPDTPTAMREGQLRFTRGDLAGAHACFKAALRQDAARVEAWSDLGVSLAADADLEGSVAALRTAVALAPDAALPRANLAAVLWQLDQVEDAVAHLRAALRADPTLPIARRLLDQLGLESSRRPRVLMVEAPRHPEATLALAWEVCLRAGVGVYMADRELVAAFASRIDDEGIATFWQAAALDALVIDAECPQAARWVEQARLTGAPVIWVGEHAPSGVRPMPRDPLRALTPLIAWADGLVQRPSSPLPPPRMSVVLDSAEHPWSLTAMLDHLALQDLPPALFEVIVVAEHDEELETGERPYAMRVVRQAASLNLARARDAALSVAQAKVLVLLDTDTRPDTDTLRGHLVGQAQTREPLALVGDVCPSHALRARAPLAGIDTRAMATPLAGAGGARLPGRYLRTGNTSLPTAAVIAAGGFATDADRASGDTSLGLRLERASRLRVQPRPELRAERDTAPELQQLLSQARSMGFDDVQLFHEHGDTSLLCLSHADDPSDPSSWFRLRARLERDGPRAQQAERLLRKLASRRLPERHAEADAARSHVAELVRVVVEHAYQRGQAAAGTDIPLVRLQPRPPLQHALTSVIVLARGGGEPLGRTLDSLRQHTAGPVEVLVVDRGLDARSRSALLTQGDVRLFGDGSNLGDARGHSLALEQARGETVVLATAGIEVPRGWRDTLLTHLQAWPDVGLVAPLLGQTTSSSGARSGQHVYSTRFDPTFVMIRREVFVAVGGLDPELGPGRLAYDDFGLRAALAGFRTRLGWDITVRYDPGLFVGGPIWPDDFTRFAARWQLPSPAPARIPTAELLDQPFDETRHFVPMSGSNRAPETPVRLLDSVGSQHH